MMSSFAFKWAKMAPLMPKPSSKNNPAYINNKDTAIFLYEGHWSLMRAMMLNQATKENGASSNEDTLLQFNVPLVHESDPNNAVGQAVLFIKVLPKVAHGNPTQRFKVPLFPHTAPALKV